jgi:hypothetical protein
MGLTADATITSSPVQDLVVPNAAQMDVRYLPSEHLVYRVVRGFQSSSFFWEQS